jgi:DnaJ-class molecular chaperone
MFKPCKYCEGNGFLVKKVNDEDVKETCEPCSGTGSAYMHIQNTYAKQLAATIGMQNQILSEIRQKTYEMFNKLKKPDSK